MRLKTLPRAAELNCNSSFSCVSLLQLICLGAIKEIKTCLIFRGTIHHRGIVLQIMCHYASLPPLMNAKSKQLCLLSQTMASEGVGADKLPLLTNAATMAQPGNK